MSAGGGALAAPPASASRTGELLRLAWPAVLSYVLNNAYRVNDQFWIRGLGPKAQAAIAATLYVQVLNYAVIFLAVGGTLALVARHTGAGDARARDSVARHALLLELALGLGLIALVVPNCARIVGWIGLRGESAVHGADFLRTLYLFMAPMALFPVVDAIFIARGNTRVPMMLQLLAVLLNYALNPLLIYGPEAAERMGAPGAALAARVASALSIEGRGIAGAALATGISRTLPVVLGLFLLRKGYSMSLLGSLRPSARTFAEILRISAPVSASVALYALAYWGILAFVLEPLGEAVLAGFGIGVQVFEGVAFPCYFGVSMAAASLIGRELGAGNRAGALAVVTSARRVASVVGATLGLAFLALGPLLVPFFAADPDVAREALLYVRVMAPLQWGAAIESVHEKVLLGAGRTRPILWIAPLGNLLRVPLCYLAAFQLGGGAAGVWWAIGVTTYVKAFLFWWKVRQGEWLEPIAASAGERAA